MERISYTLQYPYTVRIIEQGGGEREQTTTVLSFAPRVKGRHLRAMDAAEGGVAKTLALVSSLAGIARAEADEIDHVDLDAITDMPHIQEVLGTRRRQTDDGDPLDDGPPTGQPS